MGLRARKRKPPRKRKLKQELTCWFPNYIVGAVIGLLTLCLIKKGDDSTLTDVIPGLHRPSVRQTTPQTMGGKTPSRVGIMKNVVYNEILDELSTLSLRLDDLMSDNFCLSEQSILADQEYQTLLEDSASSQFQDITAQINELIRQAKEKPIIAPDYDALRTMFKSLSNHLRLEKEHLQPPTVGTPSETGFGGTMGNHGYQYTNDYPQPYYYYPDDPTFYNAYYPYYTDPSDNFGTGEPTYSDFPYPYSSDTPSNGPKPSSNPAVAPTFNPKGTRPPSTGPQRHGRGGSGSSRSGGSSKKSSDNTMKHVEDFADNPAEYFSPETSIPLGGTVPLNFAPTYPEPPRESPALQKESPQASSPTVLEVPFEQRPKKKKPDKRQKPKQYTGRPSMDTKSGDNAEQVPIYRQIHKRLFDDVPGCSTEDLYFDKRCSTASGRQHLFERIEHMKTAGDFYYRTPPHMIHQLITSINITNKDVMLDVGCGGAELLIEMAHITGARGIGIEINPWTAAKARLNVREAGMEDLIEIYCLDAFQNEAAFHKILDKHKISITFIFVFETEEKRWSFENRLYQRLPGTFLISYAFSRLSERGTPPTAVLPSKPRPLESHYLSSVQGKEPSKIISWHEIFHERSKLFIYQIPTAQECH